MVLIIDRAVIQNEGESDKTVGNLAALVTKLENEGLDHRAALKKAARELGLSRAEAYRRMVTERGK
jgi:predicted transcriptional regulator YheO